MNRVVHTSIKKNAFPRTGRVIDSVGVVAGLGSGNYFGGLGVSHSHENKSLIDQITQGNIDVLSLFEIIDGKLKIKTDVYSVGEVSAYGVGSTGGSGASGSLGGLVNVGSWADELPSADRVMIQLAGSTHWSSKLISEIAGLDTLALGNYLTSNQYATQSYVNTKVTELIGAAPTTLDTLNELATALGNDPNFATSMSTLIGTKWTQDNTKIANWNIAYSNNHTHTNKAVIDNLTQGHLDVLSHLNVVDGRIKVDVDFWSIGELSAYGAGSGTGGGTGLITSVLGSGGLGGSYLNSDLTNTFNAYTINLINNNLTSALGRIGALETNTPNVAWGTPTSSYVPLSINSTSKNISLDGHSHTFASLSSKPTTLSGYGITDALNTSSTTQTKTGKLNISGLLTLSGGIKSVVPVQNYNPFSDYKLWDSIDTNLFAGKWKKIKVSINGVENTTAAQSLFNQNFEEYAAVIGREGDSAMTLNIDLVSNGLYGANGIAYATGEVYLNFYSTRLPETYTARVKNRDGVWTDMALTLVNGAVIKGVIPIGTYLTQMEFTFTTGTGSPYVTSNIKWSLAELEYHGTRISLSQGANISSVGGYIGGSLTVDGGMIGNASTATKLQNIRTIWGQNFDGGTNVTGNLGGSWFAINDVASNPFLKLLENSNTWYLQGYANKLYLGNGTSNSIVIDNVGNVGVKGNINLEGAGNQLNITSAGSELAINYGCGGYKHTTIFNGVGSLVARFASSGNVLIGSAVDAGYKFDVTGTARITGAITGDRINTTSESHMSVGAYTDPASGIGAGLKVNGNFAAGGNSYFMGGNVLINTLTDSGYKLDVNGTTRMNGSLHLVYESWLNLYNPANTSRISLSHNSTYSVLDIYNRTTSAYAEIQCGKITAPTLSFTSATGGTIQSNNTNILRVSGTKDIVLSTPISAKIYFRPNGDISTTGQMILDQAGNLVAVGEVTAFSASDRRLKENIIPLSNSLQLIQSLNPVSYKWNSTAKELNPLKSSETDYGLIAQELEFVMPELVHSIYGGQYKSIDYVKIIPHLICAIKQLKDEIDTLKNNNIIHIN